MLYLSRMRYRWLCSVCRRQSNNYKRVVITVSIVIIVVLSIFHLSNAGDILLYYLSSDRKAFSLSIHCNEGRFGNQMCTYATLYGLGSLNKRRSILSPPCNLKHLKSVFRNLSVPEGPLFYIRWNAWSILSYYRQDDSTIPLHSNFIDGFRYPCSYTFFDHVKNEIRREFHFSEQLQQHAWKVLQKANGQSLKNVTYVGVHVRRGDYQERWLNIYKGVAVNMEYFQKAVGYFKRKYQNVVLVLVSDDRQWCLEHLSEPLGAYVAEDAPTPAHDLAVIAHCNHTVMTYGTFGFWGAYLAGGEVVYFDKFLLSNTSFAKNDFIFDKMYPPRWKGIATTNVSDFYS